MPTRRLFGTAAVGGDRRRNAGLAAYVAAGLTAIAVGLAALRGAVELREPRDGLVRYRALAARQFVDGLGVNIHAGRTATPYGDLTRTAEGLRYLGLTRVRDHISNYPAVEALAKQGFRFTLIAPGDDMDLILTRARRLERAAPGSVAAIEGPNEVDGWPIRAYDGLSGYPAARAFQRDLYRRVKADPVLAHVPVYNTSVSGLEHDRYAALGDLSAFTDYGNVHVYYGAGQPAYGWNAKDSKFHWARWLNAARTTAPGKPVVITETGSTTTPAWGGGVDEHVQARQVLNSFMDAARSGVAALYLYELVESRTGERDPEAHYGLFRHNWSPKPAATAVHHFTRILTDGSKDAAFSAGSVRYAITGVPEWGGHLLFQERDGIYDLIVWAEPDIWDESADKRITPPAIPVRVDLADAAEVAIYDPLLGAAPVRTLGRTRTVDLMITDHPIIVELKHQAPRGREPGLPLGR